MSNYDRPMSPITKNYTPVEKIPISVIAIFTGSDEVTIGTKTLFHRNVPIKYKAIPMQFYATIDGKRSKYIIDKVLDVRREAAYQIGRLGIKYTCSVDCGDCSKEIYLYRDEDEWFLEGGF